MLPSTSSLALVILLQLPCSFTFALPHLWAERAPLPISQDDTTHRLYPRPAGPPNANCGQKVTQNITAQHGPFAGPPRLVAGEECAAHEAGCSIASGKMYGVTLTWQAGADLFLNLGGFLTVGLLGGVAVGTTTTDAITTTVVCPSMCECGIQAVPQLYHVEGTQTTVEVPVENGPCKKPVTAPYSVDLPVLDQGAGQADQAIALFSACRVANTTCVRDTTLPECPSSS